MLYFWSIPLLYLLTTLFIDIAHSTPIHFNDQIDFMNALNKAFDKRHVVKREVKNNEEYSGEFELMDGKKDKLMEDYEKLKEQLHLTTYTHHQFRHLRLKHRRSLKSTSQEVAKNVPIPGELHLHKRSKHLMLTKPYWPWP